MKSDLRVSIFSVVMFTAIFTVATFSGSAFAANTVVVIPLEADRPRLENIVTVAKSGGDFTDIIRAIRSIRDASESKPYIVYLAPGVYNTTQTITLPAYISLIGSGTKATIINANFEASSFALTVAAGIASSYNNEIANLTLNRNAENFAVGAYNQNQNGNSQDTNIQYSNVAINLNSPVTSRAIINDVNGFGARLALDNVSINIAGSAQFSYGIENRGGGAVRRIFDGINAELDGSRLLIGISNSANANLTLLNSNINVTSSTVTQIIGIENRGSNNVDIRNTIVLAGGSMTTSSGISNSSFAVSNIEGSQIRSFQSSIGQVSYGVNNTISTARARVVNSSIYGDTSPIRSGTGSGANETYVSFSTLGGDGETSGLPVCQFNVDENNTPLTSTCRVP